MPRTTRYNSIWQDLEQAFSQASEGDFSGLALIVRALNDVNPEVRLEAASLCGQIGPARAVVPLSRMANGDAASQNRIQASYALTGVGLPATVPALIAALGDGDPDCRSAARVALFRLMGTATLRLLAEDGFDDAPDPEERGRVAAWWSDREHELEPAHVYAFGQPASPRVFIDRLATTTTSVPDALYASLRDWTGEDFGDSPRGRVRRAWEAWWAEHATEYVAGVRYFHGQPVPATTGAEGSPR